VGTASYASDLTKGKTLVLQQALPPTEMRGGAQMEAPPKFTLKQKRSNLRQAGMIITERHKSINRPREGLKTGFPGAVEEEAKAEFLN